MGFNGFTVFDVATEPDGTQFNLLVTRIFQRSDADNNGVLDGALIREDALLITKDNDAITERGGKFEGFDPVNNTITFTVASLSEFALASFDEEGPMGRWTVCRRR